MTYVLLFLFLFKRKTAYEMRSSDWSSDVCSSDLWVMFYNTALFEQNGVDVPATWSERNQVAATLKANGVTPYYQTSTLFTFQWFQHMVASRPEARRVGKEWVSTCRCRWAQNDYKQNTNPHTDNQLRCPKQS